MDRMDTDLGRRRKAAGDRIEQEETETAEFLTADGKDLHRTGPLAACFDPEWSF